MLVRNQREAEAVVRLFRAAGIPASTDVNDIRKNAGFRYGGKKAPIYIDGRDDDKTEAVLRSAIPKFLTAHYRRLNPN